MISTINRLTVQYEKKHKHRPNLLYINNKQLELLIEQFCETKIDVISQLIGMEIIIVQDLQQSYVSWAQISWKHNSIA
ncbi:MAG: hypothetical protein QM479_04905 [Pseudomonadota bacterium]